MNMECYGHVWTHSLVFLLVYIRCIHCNYSPIIVQELEPMAISVEDLFLVGI